MLYSEGTKRYDYKILFIYAGRSLVQYFTKFTVFKIYSVVILIKIKNLGNKKQG